MTSCKLNDETLCQLANCVTQVEGMATDSASTTDIWKLTVRPETRINGVEVRDKLVLKIWPTSADGFEFNPANRDELVEQIEALNREAAVYARSREWILNRVCPNFVMSYGARAPGACNPRDTNTAFGCNMDSLVQILVTGLHDTPEAATNRFKQAMWHLHHNISTKQYIRTPITQQSTKRLGNPRFQPPTSYNFLLTNFAVGCEPLIDVLRRRVKLQTPRKQWQLILQMTAIAYTMELAGVEHNDLHTGNIFYCEHQSIPVRYDYSNTSITYNETFRLLAYDFDYASLKYCERNVPGEITRKLRGFTQDDRYARGRDLMKMISGLGINSIVNEFATFLGFTPQQDLSSFSDLRVSSTIYRRFNKGWTEIFNFLHSKVDDSSIRSSSVLPDHVYTCNRDTFDQYGFLSSSEDVAAARQAEEAEEIRRVEVAQADRLAKEREAQAQVRRFVEAIEADRLAKEITAQEAVEKAKQFSQQVGRLAAQKLAAEQLATTQPRVERGRGGVGQTGRPKRPPRGGPQHKLSVDNPWEQQNPIGPPVQTVTGQQGRVNTGKLPIVWNMQAPPPAPTKLNQDLAQIRNNLEQLQEQETNLKQQNKQVQSHVKNIRKSMVFSPIAESTETENALRRTSSALEEATEAVQAVEEAVEEAAEAVQAVEQVGEYVEQLRQTGQDVQMQQVEELVNIAAQQVSNAAQSVENAKTATRNVEQQLIELTSSPQIIRPKRNISPGKQPPAKKARTELAQELEELKEAAVENTEFVVVHPLDLVKYIAIDLPSHYGMSPSTRLTFMQQATREIQQLRLVEIREE